MAVKIELHCDKCELVETHIATSILSYASMDFMKPWKEVDNMILCKDCIKDWSKFVKKNKKDNKEKFLKDK
ncbi:MAG: hypothetical protein DRI23_08145 [Candidatus Cloacimonadota bacterium]|nr:MAG: hypothetical protein DRI23_08145 [Candidatus Cloacimonadota bacterium]